MSSNFLKAIFATDESDEVEPGTLSAEDAAELGVEPGVRRAPRSITDSWERLASEIRGQNERLAALAEAEQELLEVVKTLSDTSKQQLEVLHLLGKFHEAAEKRGRELEHEFQGVPEVLRMMPSATREQAEKLSEIAARLYEKAQDNTVNALKSAQANHVRAVEDLIDRSLGASRRLTGWAMLLLLVAAVGMLLMYLELRQL